jgi:fumarylacetoacetate (FAA) hydrolase family protein
MKLNLATCLPANAEDGCLLGRVWTGGAIKGPAVVTIENGRVYDISYSYPLMSELLEEDDIPKAVESANRVDIGDVFGLLNNSDQKNCDPRQPFFLAPCDLQAVKACGVTFANSLLERLVEEYAKGDPVEAAIFRDELHEGLEFDFASIVPGSEEARTLKNVLIEKNLWSQYLEVGIGPDAEVFSKALPLASVGTGATLGIRSDSVWNNPEPEIVLAVNSRGIIVGASLGNDVNLRDFEGRSALLLGKAKDNNAASVIGPFIRVIDDSFTLDDLRTARVMVEVSGKDGFLMRDSSNMEKISRDIKELVKQTIGGHHQYPDGLMLYTGTLFAPIHDRDREGEGFTHKIGDVVKISSEKLGAIVNRVEYCHILPPWEFGCTALFRNLVARKLI